MSRFRFTPEMFSIGFSFKEGDAAAQANAALDEHLNELKIVYRQPGFGGHSWQENLHDASGRTHTALLFDIEELKPAQCLHSSLRTRHDGKLDCADCGKVLEYRLVEM